MKKYSAAVFAAALAAALTACQKDDTDKLVQQQQALLATDEMGVYSNGASVFLFDDAEHQAFYNTKGYVTRIQSDDMTETVNLTMDKKPVSNIQLTAVTEVVGISAVSESRFNCTVLKTGSDRIWLWDDDHNIGYIMFWGN